MKVVSGFDILKKCSNPRCGRSPVKYSVALTRSTWRSIETTLAAEMPNHKGTCHMCKSDMEVVKVKLELDRI